jgi:hypothetical protein
VQIIGVCETKSHECSCRIDDSAWYLAGTLSLVRRLGVHDSLLPYSTQQRSVHAETGIVNGPGPLAREEVLVVFVSSGELSQPTIFSIPTHVGPLISCDSSIPL